MKQSASKTSFSAKQVGDIANLAKIPISETQKNNLAVAFDETLHVVDKLKSVDVSNVEETHQVTQLSNVWREDKVDLANQFSPDEALANAPRRYQNYFVVNQIIDQEE